MNGILNVLKPPGMTSHDVIYFIRRVTGIKKAGHTGTLDPEAAGVLPVCIGKATKAVQYLTNKKKGYRANIKFGIVTDTYDGYGSVIRNAGKVTVAREELEAVLPGFLGSMEQQPPIYSAIKLKGKKLYEYALEGKQVEIAGRPVEIYALRIVDMLSDDEAMIDIECSKGTYVRSLCYDIGEALGCGAYMSRLIRLESSPFRLEQAHTLEEIEKAASLNRLGELLEPVEKLFTELPCIKIKDSAKNSVLNGGFLYSQGVYDKLEELPEDADIRIYDSKGFMAIGTVKYETENSRKYVRVKNLFLNE